MRLYLYEFHNPGSGELRIVSFSSKIKVLELYFFVFLFYLLLSFIVNCIQLVH